MLKKKRKTKTTKTCYEEKKQYDQKRKMTVTIGTHLIGKKIKGTEEIVPTRPKRKFINTTKEVMRPTGKVEAVRKHVGMMDIVNHMGKGSGVDEDLRSITDLPTADTPRKFQSHAGMRFRRFETT